jgi:hypothetical protein
MSTVFALLIYGRFGLLKSESTILENVAFSK